MANTLWQVVAAYAFALAGGWISTSLQLGAQAALRADQFRGRNASRGNTLCDFAGKFGRVFLGGRAFLALATGYALFFFISKHVHHVCPACAASHFDADATRHFSEIATALIVALAIHSTTDGLALGIQAGSSCDRCDKMVALLRSLHSQSSRRPRARQPFDRRWIATAAAALGWVAAVEATTLLGGVIGYFFLANISTFWLGLIMAQVGGGFIYLAAHAVLGEMLKHGKKLVLTSFSVGVALIAVLNIGLRIAWLARFAEACRSALVASEAAGYFSGLGECRRTGWHRTA